MTRNRHSRNSLWPASGHAKPSISHSGTAPPVHDSRLSTKSVLRAHTHASGGNVQPLAPEKPGSQQLTKCGASGGRSTPGGEPAPGELAGRLTR